MHTFGFSFLYSYLKRWEQNFRINNTHSIYQILLSGVPQLSILGPTLFSTFVNHLFFWISNPELLNFADNNTTCVAKNAIEELISTIELPTDWFNVNTDKFQAVVKSNFIEITLRHRCSPVNLLHIFRRAFTENASGWLLLEHLQSRNFILDTWY